MQCLIPHTYTHTHSLSLVLVVMMKSKELKTKISHAHSLILSLLLCVWVALCLLLSLCVAAPNGAKSFSLNCQRDPCCVPGHPTWGAMPGLPNVADEYGTLRGTSAGPDRWGPFGPFGPSVAAEPMNLLAAMHGRPPPGVSFDDQMQAFLQSMEDQDDEFGDEFGDDSEADDSGEDDSGDDDSGEDASEGDGSAGDEQRGRRQCEQTTKGFQQQCTSRTACQRTRSPQGWDKTVATTCQEQPRMQLRFWIKISTAKLPAAGRGCLVRLPLLTECTVG